MAQKGFKRKAAPRRTNAHKGFIATQRELDASVGDDDEAEDGPQDGRCGEGHGWAQEDE